MANADVLEWRILLLLSYN